MAGTVRIDQRDNALVATLINPPHGQEAVADERGYYA